MDTYKIVRMFQQEGRRRQTIRTGLTLEQAQAHCQDPETSSSTATGAKAQARTRRLGAWFDGYEEETPAVRVESPSWRRNGPQVWHDSWRNRDRVLRFMGECVTCGRRTYAFDDGENDPRGVLGDHAADPLVAEEYERRGPDVPQCFLCGNDYDRYQHSMRVAERRWTRFEERHPIED
jgi:hypothetical protein